MVDWTPLAPKLYFPIIVIVVTMKFEPKMMILITGVHWWSGQVVFFTFLHHLTGIIAIFIPSTMGGAFFLQWTLMISRDGPIWLSGKIANS